MSISECETEVESALQKSGTPSLMDVYWLGQTQTDVPADDTWLSAREKFRLSGLRFAKRRSDWRLGRWTAKRALAAFLNMPDNPPALADIEIRATPSGAPEGLLRNQMSPLTISLSHSSNTAMCAVARASTGLGCDLEVIEPRADAFVADYFTVNEQKLVERATVEERRLLVTLLWSAKESTLKVLREGLRLDTNCVDVSPVDVPSPEGQDGRQDPVCVPLLSTGLDAWRPLRIRHAGTQVFGGWWRHAGHLVRTIVSIPPSYPPIHLEPSPAREHPFSSTLSL